MRFDLLAYDAVCFFSYRNIYVHLQKIIVLILFKFCKNDPFKTNLPTAGSLEH
jgi:hypothetical protein